MLSPDPADPLPSTLRAAEAELAERLQEACARADVHDESTGELMRLEETLLDAARAAKQAVSVRRRLRSRAAERALADRAPADRPTADRQVRVPGASATDGSSTSVSSLSSISSPSSNAGETSSETSSASTSAADAGAAPRGPAEVAVRNLVDPTGVEWQVWEVSPSALTRTGAVLSDYREGWLAFESVDGTRHRRLPSFPRDWTRLTNLELEHLLGRAEEVKRKTRSRSTTRPAEGEAGA